MDGATSSTWQIGSTPYWSLYASTQLVISLVGRRAPNAKKADALFRISWTRILLQLLGEDEPQLPR